MEEWTEYDKVSWDDFTRAFKWRQGEHLVCIKPTGGGKSTLLGAVLPFQKAPATVVFVTKIHDDTFNKMFPRSEGWHRVEEWPPPRYVNKVLLWPRFSGGKGRTLRDVKVEQRRVFSQALDSIFWERGWTVVLDEENYLCAELGLADEVAMFHHQGRSSGITVVDGIQRPKNVPLVTLSSATHAFIGNTTDVDDLKRLSELGGLLNRKQLAATLQDLDYYEFLYVPTRAKGKRPVRTTVTT